MSTKNRLQLKTSPSHPFHDFAATAVNVYVGDKTVSDDDFTEVLNAVSNYLIDSLEGDFTTVTPDDRFLNFVADNLIEAWAGQEDLAGQMEMTEEDLHLARRRLAHYLVNENIRPELVAVLWDNTQADHILYDLLWNPHVAPELLADLYNPENEMAGRGLTLDELSGEIDSVRDGYSEAPEDEERMPRSEALSDAFSARHDEFLS